MMRMISDKNGPRVPNILFSTLGGVCGALAIIAYAASAHSGASQLGIIAPLLLGHAPALLVLSIFAPLSRAALLGGVLLIVGLMLFCGSLLYLELIGNRLFPYSAPLGGILMIIGWLTASTTGWFSKKA